MEDVASTGSAESKLHFLDYWRIVRIRKFVILSVFLLVVLTTTLVTLWLPPSYDSMVRIAVDKDIADVATLGGQQSYSGMDPFFIQTEFEKIQSTTILHKVIKDLNLSAKWAKSRGLDGELPISDTYLLLKKQMDVRQTRGTSLIEIRVYDRDPKEAAAIAEKIATVYSETRKEQRLERSMGGIKKLNEQQELQQKKVKEAQEFADRLRTDLNISDVVAEGNLATSTLEMETLRRKELMRIEAHLNWVDLNATMERLTKLNRERLRKSLLTVKYDVSLEKLLTDHAQTEQQLTVKRKDYAEDHPEVLKAASLLSNINSQVEAKVEGIMLGLETKLAAFKAQDEILTTEVNEAKEKEIKGAEKNRPYFKAKRELESHQRVLDALTVRVASETVDASLPRILAVEITDHAEESLRPVRPNIPLNIVLGVIVGLVVGFGLAFFIEYLDTSVKTIDDIERTLQAPVIGVIPQNAGSMVTDGGDSPHAEAYRVLRTNVLFSRKDDKLNSITIVSGGAGEGKSTTIFNLATVFAQQGQKILLVDSDLRRPSLHKILKVSNSIGLTNYLLKQNTLEEVIQTTSLPTLDFLPSGRLPSSALGILNSTQMKEFIQEAKRRYDFVFFDSPPIMGVSDASVLASEMDMTLLCVQYRKYPQAMTVRAKQTVDKVGGKLLGVVLNNINISQDSYYYYYSGDYYNQTPRPDDDEPGQPNGAPAKTPGDQAKLDLKRKY